MLVDSHCHLNFLDLTQFNNSLNEVLQQAKEKKVNRFLSVCVQLKDYPELIKIAEHHPEVSISVGIHPNDVPEEPITTEELVRLAQHPSCIAFGETGLDFYRTEGVEARAEQEQRFRAHIRAAIAAEKPLIIHTRQAADATIRVLKEENAKQIGGVMHCFAESLDIAQQAMDLGFYISLSGIISFKNAVELQEVARALPLDRILIETDSPYLAPVPFRGKQNHPALVYYVAQALADLRGIGLEEVALATTENFKQCFRL